ncbi:MAG: SpaA isopeptide-forming pilin-related protein [Candidatus Faecimonas sp.]|nr:Cys-Gln thioester bond-forming surface protein [Mycoplasmatota bacterium]MDY2908550.1 SpaA isopeptide-forming pilin-related protein [Candidatus Faecimonas sp.]
MKKFKKILVAILIAVVSYCTLTTTVNAVPDKIELGSPESVPGYVAGTHFTTKVSTSGELMYCLNIHKYTAQNSTAYLVGELDAGVAYIMLNGYPTKSFTGEKLKDYYITQTALWWYLDDTTGSSNLSASFKKNGSDKYNLRPYIKQLVSGAKTAKEKGYAKTTISASVSDNIMSMTSDGKNYVSEEVKVSSTNISEYKVSITSGPEGTTVIDNNGKEKNTFSSNETFKVKVPVSKVDNMKETIKVKISATGKVYKAYEYQPEVQNQQNITPSIISPEAQNVETSIDLTISTSKITIVKIDKATGNALAGAKLVLRDSEGKEITSWTSTTLGHVIKNLPNGTYTVEEVEAPAGYELNKEVVTFTIGDNSREQKIKFYNEAKERVVNIIKVDQSTGQPLAGAVIVVKDANGKEAARFTSTTDPYVLTGLEDGTYTVEEISAPSGYQKSNEIYSFTLDAEHVSHQITIENAPVVDVPNTGVASSILLVILGLGIIGGGIRFVQKNSKQRI